MIPIPPHRRKDMKATYYTDIFSFTRPDNLFLTPSPEFPKPDNCKRYRIEIEIPDPEVDATIQAQVTEATP